MRYVFPYLLMRYVQRKQKEFMGKMQDNQNAQQRKPGEVNVDFTPDKSSKSKLDDVGEYTEFEDLEPEDKS